MSGRSGQDPPAPESRVAVLERRGKFLVAEPFFGPGARQVVSRSSRAGVGDLVLLGRGPRGGAASGGRSGVGGHGRPARGGGGRSGIVRRIGRPDVARDVIEALMLDRGLGRSFDPAVEREARGAATGTPAASDGERRRRDLRALPTFTIDPTSARDFDDAISCQAEDDGYHVWVHIADVSAYVPARSLVDREAYRRATSVYVPAAVEPMLPEVLSNGVCSLVPGQDRCAVTVELHVASDGAVSRASFHRSLIRSDERLDYDRVDRIFAGTERSPAPWGEPLAAARGAAAALAQRRAVRGALVIERPEPEFEFDPDGHVLAARPVPQTESHRLIEHLMIAANEQVAGLLEARKIPTLYRVHERPEGEAVRRLADQLASLEVPTPPIPRGHLTGSQASELVNEISVAVEAYVSSRGGQGRRAFGTLVLRSLKQALYEPRNLGHAGLGSPRYCHFTSPIRRYPDLVCHRALLSAIGATDEPAPDAAFVTAAGPWSSTRERGAMVIERDADDIARAYLLERMLRSGELSDGREHEFDGEVVSVIGAGAFVAFGEQGFQGLLPVRRLRGEWWELNELSTMLIGTRSGATIRLGDPVRVQVGGIDAPRGRVDLLPVSL